MSSLLEKSQFRMEMAGVEAELQRMFDATLAKSFKDLNSGHLTPDGAMLTLKELMVIKRLGAKLGVSIADATKEE